MGLALAHPEPPPLHDVARVGLQIDQDQQQPILRRRPRTVLVSRVPAGGARLPIEAPVHHMGLERGLKGGSHALTLRHGKTGHIEHLCGAGLEIGAPYTAPGGGLLSSEAQDTFNRDEL